MSAPVYAYSQNNVSFAVSATERCANPRYSYFRESCFSGEEWLISLSYSHLYACSTELLISVQIVFPKPLMFIISSVE